MDETRSVLWNNPLDRSADLCVLTPTEQGWLLEGLVLVPIDEGPARCEYRVEADASWGTRSARVDVQHPVSGRSVELRRSGDQWLVNEVHEPALDGCTDIDLRVTPATNTLPIRRLALAVGDASTLRAAWVGFPDLAAVASPVGMPGHRKRRR